MRFRGLALFFRTLDVLKLSPDLLQPPGVAFGVPEIKEVPIPFMGAFHTSEMFDRTPVLFRPGGDFPDIV
jgi:hypothetical protein